jgi:hypothetical protein
MLLSEWNLDDALAIAREEGRNIERGVVCPLGKRSFFGGSERAPS